MTAASATARRACDGKLVLVERLFPRPMCRSAYATTPRLRQRHQCRGPARPVSPRQPGPEFDAFLHRSIDDMARQLEL